MGFFTWTFNSTQASIGYDRKVILALPDDSFLIEPSYDGYGIINGYDVYDLVVDWNRGTKEAVSIVERHISELKKELEKGPDEFRRQFIEKELPQLSEIREYVSGKTDFLPGTVKKRNVGITLACQDEDLATLKYPIRFVQNKKIPYALLEGFSHSTQ